MRICLWSDFIRLRTQIYILFFLIFYFIFTFDQRFSGCSNTVTTDLEKLSTLPAASGRDDRGARRTVHAENNRRICGHSNNNNTNKITIQWAGVLGIGLASVRLAFNPKFNCIFTWTYYLFLRYPQQSSHILRSAAACRPYKYIRIRVNK